MRSSEEIGGLLSRVSDGDSVAAYDLIAFAHDELRRLARTLMRSQGRDHTLQPTALVHEAFLRMVESGVGECEDLRHFIRKATKVMRHTLIDHERAKHAEKRGGHAMQTTLSQRALGEKTPSTKNLIDVDLALQSLAAESPDLAAVVELRYFGGLDVEGVAQTLEIGKRTAERRWQLARMWLRDELTATAG